MIVQQWLDMMCQMLPRAQRGIVLCDFDRKEDTSPAACWPVPEVEYGDLAAAAVLAAGRNAPVVSSQAANTETGHGGDLVAAFPLQVENSLFGVVAVQLEAGSEHQTVINQLLEWGQAWLSLLLRPATASANSLPLTSEVLTAGFRHEGIDAAAAAVAVALTDAYACNRAVVGLLQQGQIRVRGISDGATFDPRVSTIRSLEALMAMTGESGQTLVYPPHQEGVTENTAFAAVLETLDKHHVCAVPMRNGDELVGVILLERELAPGFSVEDIRCCEELGGLLGAQFALKLEHQQPLFQSVKAAAVARVQQLVGPGHLRFKFAAGALVLAMFSLVFLSGDYRVSAPAGIEGKIQRAVVAPFEGYVANASARAGETVRAGEVIAELEDRELQLELRRWLSERDEVSKQYRKALAELDHSQARIFRAQVDQAQAQLELIDQKLRRSQLVAPIDGIIISGDLSRSLGAPVARGDVLFEVAPLEEYRVVLQIDEREISDIRAGQQGWLSLSALANQKIRFEIEQVATVFQEQDGKVSYRTEARIIDDISTLRPGMQGIGKVSIEPRSYGWILFHSMIDWLRIRLWSLLP